MLSLHQRNLKENNSLMKNMATHRNDRLQLLSRIGSQMTRNGPNLKQGVGKTVFAIKNLISSAVSPEEAVELQEIEEQQQQEQDRHRRLGTPGVGDEFPLMITQGNENNDMDATSPQTVITISGVDAKLSDIGMPLMDLKPKVDTVEELAELEAPDLSAFQDLADVRVVLKTLQSLCDLEFLPAQNLIREQPNNVKSVNLVAEACNFLALLYTNIDPGFIDIVSELLETLIEFVQGNQENQAVVFDAKIIDYLNHMLRTEEYTDCSDGDVLRLKNAIGIIIKFLVEENQAARGKYCQSKMILTAVNMDGIWQTAHDLMHAAITQNGMAVEKKNVSADIGFIYYHIVLRAMDLNLFNEENIPESQMHIWLMYKKETMSLEFLKNEVLQRVYYRVTDQKALRREVEEKLKWEVDRSSYGNKMRDFKSWIKDIHDDILFQRRINSHFLTKFFVRQWKAFNYLNLFLTLLLNILMIVLWKENVHREGRQDFWLYHKADYDIFWRSMGVLHNICTFCLVASYFLSNGAGFISSKNTMTRRIRKVNRLVMMSATIKSGERPSKLETPILGVQTLYYVVFFAFSILGTVISPAFFAFHLLQIVENNQLLTRVIRAVTLNGRSLLWVAFLGLLLIYMYALAGFMALRKVYQGNYHFCSSLLECFGTTMREGLVYRMMRVDYPIKGKWEGDSRRQGAQTLLKTTAITNSMRGSFCLTSASLSLF